MIVVTCATVHIWRSEDNFWYQTLPSILFKLGFLIVHQCDFFFPRLLGDSLVYTSLLALGTLGLQRLVLQISALCGIWESELRCSHFSKCFIQSHLPSPLSFFFYIFILLILGTKDRLNVFLSQSILNTTFSIHHEITLCFPNSDLTIRGGFSSPCTASLFGALGNVLSYCGATCRSLGHVSHCGGHP